MRGIQILAPVRRALPILVFFTTVFTTWQMVLMLPALALTVWRIMAEPDVWEVVVVGAISVLAIVYGFWLWNRENRRNDASRSELHKSIDALQKQVNQLRKPQGGSADSESDPDAVESGARRREIVDAMRKLEVREEIALREELLRIRMMMD